MFDSLYVECPECGKPITFQSKAGYCTLMHYTLENVPGVIAADLDGKIEYCSCGNKIELRLTAKPVLYIKDNK